MTQRVEEWMLSRPDLSLAEFIRAVNLPIVSITPTAWRTEAHAEGRGNPGLTVTVGAIVVFDATQDHAPA